MKLKRKSSGSKTPKLIAVAVGVVALAAGGAAWFYGRHGGAHAYSAHAGE